MDNILFGLFNMPENGVPTTPFGSVIFNQTGKDLQSQNRFIRVQAKYTDLAVHVNRIKNF